MQGKLNNACRRPAKIIERAWETALVPRLEHPGSLRQRCSGTRKHASILANAADSCHQGSLENGVGRFADTVVTAMRELPETQAGSVARTILRIPSDDARPVPLTVTGDPPTTKYRAAVPAGDGPAVIFRAALPGEPGRFTAAALMDRDAFEQYLPVETNDIVQSVAD